MAGSRDEREDGDDREWRFSIEEFDDPDETGDGSREGSEEFVDSGDRDSDGDGLGGNVAGSLGLDEPLEPGEIDLENTLFVLAVVLLTIGFVASAVLAL